MEKKLKIYLDTSVIGGCYDEEFSEWSNLLFEEFKEDARHIVNLDRIRNYNSVNLKYGYRIIEIRTPKEVLEYEENI
jgi:hypothetical protein